MDNGHAMKNERYLIKKINEKIIKTCIILLGLTFIMGFYDERNLYVSLEEVTIELGDKLPENNLDYISNHLINSDFVLESNVPVNDLGETIKIGTYNYYVVHRNEERMYSRLTNKKSTISVIDTIRPVVEIKENSLKWNYGSKIKASDIAKCYDLSECSLSFKNEIDTKKSGNHEIIIVAIDEGNNVTEETVTITIKEKPVYYSMNFSSMDINNNSLNGGLSNEEIIAKRNEIIAYAKQFAGNPYVYGGNSLTNGTDCSGFTMLVYNHFGYQLPRVATSQGFVGMAVSVNQLLPGDLVVYFYPDGGGHVGLYLGNGMMIHAGTPQTGIVIAPVFAGNKVYRRIIY